MRPVAEAQKPQRGVPFLYGTRLGGLCLKFVSARWVSRLAGKYFDSRLSKHKIKKFIKKHGIETGDYLPGNYKSFNAFFTRKIRPGLRPFDMDGNALCSPCDGAATAFSVTHDGKFTVKGFAYTVASLLRDEELAKKYEGGLCLILRLTVKDYHRYHFIDGGTAGEGKYIGGKLHTVQPQALAKRRVFTENCRECTVLHTENFGDVTQVEVGAMFVGRIVNEGKRTFVRGEEKGYFEFGGSTVILLFEEGRAVLDEEFFSNTAAGLETAVKCGERIGYRGHKILGKERI